MTLKNNTYLAESITRNKKYLLVLLVLFIGSLYITLMGKPLIDDLDPSWQFTFNYALTHHLSFGDQIIFTYGPMGFISYDITNGLNFGLIILTWLVRLIFIIYFIARLYEFVIEMTINVSQDIAWFAKYILLPFMVYKFGQQDYNVIIFICFIHACVVNVLNGGRTIPGNFLSRNKLLLNIFIGFTASLLFFIKVSFFPVCSISARCCDF